MTAGIANGGRRGGFLLVCEMQRQSIWWANGGAQHDPVALPEPLANFDLRTVICFEFKVHELDAIVSHDRCLQSVLGEDHSCRWNSDNWRRRMHLEMDSAVESGSQRAVVIIDVDFGEDCSCAVT